jgi:hypothetical protein
MAWLLAGSWAWACSVPVYRYAFELWAPDEYEVVLFHHGELKGEHVKLRELLNPKAGETAPVPNIRIHDIDLLTNKIEIDRIREKLSSGQAGEEDLILRRLKELERWQKLWDDQGPKGTNEPWLFVFYPAQTGKPVTVWNGKFTKASMELVFTSPARRDLAKRIQAGDNAVWVLLESGNAASDKALRERLEGYLKKLEKNLKLPELKIQDIEAGLISVSADDLSIRFSVLSIAPDDAKESVFRAMLMSAEPDLKDHVGALVFPVFGRGRSLFAMTEKGVTEDNVAEDCAFLTGPCSCQVKRQNPGFDLLTSADWDKLKEEQLIALDKAKREKVNVQTPAPKTKAVGETTGPTLPLVETVVKNEASKPTPPAPKPTQPAPKPSGETSEQPASSASFGLIPIVGGAALLILLVGGGILLTAKRE